MTLNEKYRELTIANPRGGMVFKHVGIRNREGGWIIEPMPDPDHGGAIPMLRFFAITGNQKAQQQRIHDIVNQGWEPFKPSPEPAEVKKATTRSRKSSSE